MTLVREMPVSSAAQIMEITDKQLWRVVDHYVGRAMSRLDLSELVGVGLDETAIRHQEYVTVFVDLDRPSRPVLFAVPGKGKECLKAFRAHLEKHGGNSSNVAEVVCDMSPAFLAGANEQFEHADITVGWFHVVKLFTDAVDKVRRMERKLPGFPKSLRWAVLKGEEQQKTECQQLALLELENSYFATATAYRIKELLRWIRHAQTAQAAKWRITRFIDHAENQAEWDRLLAR